MLLGGLHQFFSKIRVSDRNKKFCPFPCGATSQVDRSILSHYIKRLTAGISHNVSMELRNDAGAELSALVSKSRGHADERGSSFGLKGTRKIVQLSAGTADMP